MSIPRPDDASTPASADVTWVDARLRQPRDGQLVLAAISGRYPPARGRASSPDDDFWLVLPVHFRRRHLVGETVVRDCYLDADQVVCRPFGSGAGGEEVTHWTALPGLPGQSVTQIVGAAAVPARSAALAEPHCGHPPTSPA